MKDHEQAQPAAEKPDSSPLPNPLPQRAREDIDPEIAALLDFEPVAGWALKGAVAYSGTRALGEAAARYFEART